MHVQGTCTAAAACTLQPPRSFPMQKAPRTAEGKQLGSGRVKRAAKCRDATLAHRSKLRWRIFLVFFLIYIAKCVRALLA